MRNQLLAISPIDGRYYEKTMDLAAYFSEFALIKYRIIVEIKYLIYLHKLGIRELSGLTDTDIKNIVQIYENFDVEDAFVVRDGKILEIGLKPELDNFDYTKEQSEEGYKNFTVIQCKIKTIEWLYLAAKGHRRAKFDLESNKDTWLIP